MTTKALPDTNSGSYMPLPPGIVSKAEPLPILSVGLVRSVVFDR